ncbi:hypothetical protein [Mycobacterium parascrofulaceum]
MAAGARIGGGCCQVRPADIAELRRACTGGEKSAKNWP